MLAVMVGVRGLQAQLTSSTATTLSAYEPYTSFGGQQLTVGSNYKDLLQFDITPANTPALTGGQQYWLEINANIPLGNLAGWIFNLAQITSSWDGSATYAYAPNETSENTATFVQEGNTVYFTSAAFNAQVASFQAGTDISQQDGFDIHAISPGGTATFTAVPTGEIVAMAVPEPTSVVLLLGTGMLLILRKKTGLRFV